MGNSRTRSVNYKPRYTNMEAYDLCPKEVRDALKEGPQGWSAAWCLRRLKKLEKKHPREYAIKKVVADVWRGTNSEVRDGKPWRPRKPGQRWADLPASPHNLANATIQMSIKPYKTPRS